MQELLYVNWPMFINKAAVKFFIFLCTFILSSSLLAWTDSINSGSPIKAIHVNEIRNVINLKRQCYGLPASTWTDTSIAQGTTIKSVHFKEVRTSINNLYTSCMGGLCGGGSGVFATANTIWSQVIPSGAPIQASSLMEIRTALDGITCTPYTYNWLPGGYGACVGGTGFWSYGGWGGCTGGSGYWNYGGWGGCSTSCGDGTQYRGYSCEPYGNSGIQYRAATCNFSASSGIQTRPVLCQRSDSLIVADSFCAAIPRPGTTIACTPTNTAVCGAVSNTAQVCTPYGVGCPGGPYNAQYCNNGPCCTPANESNNMCRGLTFTASAYGTWDNYVTASILAINANAACNQFSPGRCQAGSANVIFITPCTACILQFVTCQCN